MEDYNMVGFVDFVVADMGKSTDLNFTKDWLYDVVQGKEGFGDYLLRAIRKYIYYNLHDNTNRNNHLTKRQLRLTNDPRRVMSENELDLFLLQVFKEKLKQMLKEELGEYIPPPPDELNQFDNKYPELKKK